MRACVRVCVCVCARARVCERESYIFTMKLVKQRKNHSSERKVVTIKTNISACVCAYLSVCVLARVCSNTYIGRFKCL